MGFAFVVLFGDVSYVVGADLASAKGDLFAHRRFVGKYVGWTVWSGCCRSFSFVFVACR